MLKALLLLSLINIFITVIFYIKERKTIHTSSQCNIMILLNNLFHKLFIKQIL
jgi:hypothetical protein